MEIRRNVMASERKSIKGCAVEAAALWLYHNGSGRLIDIYSEIRTGRGRPYKRLVTKGALQMLMRGDNRFSVYRAGREGSTWSLTERGVHWVENEA